MDVDLTLRAFKMQKIENPIQVARDGEEAIRILEALKSPEEFPCLIILDIKLPKFDGFEVLEEIRSDPRFKTMPVVILTTSSNDLDVKRAYGLGADSYIVKPVDFEEFKAIIRGIAISFLS